MTPAPEQWGDLMKLLGVAAPLVGLLWLLLKQATEERRVITDRFLSALESTVAASTKAMHETTVATLELSVTISQDRRVAADEHSRIVDAIGKIGRRDA